MTGILLTAAFLWVLAMGLLTPLKPQLADMILCNTMRARVTFEEIQLDLFTNFPNLRLELRDAKFISSNPWEKDLHPFEINRAYLELATFDIIPFKQKRLPYIGFEGVRAHMVVDSNGINCHGFFPHYDPNRPMPDHTDIEQIAFKNAVLLYENRGDDRGYEWVIDSIRTGIDIFPHYVLFDPQISGELKYMFEEDLRYLEGIPVRIGAQFSMLKAERALDIQSLDLLVAGNNRFFVQGRFPASARQYYNLTFQAPDGDIGALLEILPDATAQRIEAFDPKGKFAFSGLLEGEDTDTDNPNFSLDFETEDGALNASVFGAKLSNLRIKGSYTNGDNQNATSTEVKLSEVRGNLNGRPLYATLALSRLDNPYVSATLNAGVSLGDLPRIQQIPVRRQPTGLVTVDVAFAGLIDDVKHRKTIDKLDITGEVVFDSVSLSPNQLPIEIENASGRIVLGDSTARVDSMRMMLNGQDIMFSAQFEKLFKYIAGTTPTFALDAQLDVYKLAIDDLLTSLDTLPVVGSQADALSMKSKEDIDPKASLGYLLAELPEHLDVDFSLNGRQVSYRQMTFDRVIADLTLKDQILKMNELSFSNKRDGIVLRGAFNTAQPKINTYEGALNVSSANLKGLLKDAALKMGEGIDTLVAGNIDFGLQLVFDGKAKRATAGGVEDPAANMNMKLTNGYLRLPGEELSVTDMNFNTRVNQDLILAPKQTPLGVNDLTLKLNGYPVKASIDMRDLETKEMAINLSSHIALKTLMRLLPLDGLENPEGELAFDTEIYGKLDDLINPDSLLYIRSVGTLSTFGLGATFAEKKLRVKNVDGVIDYDEDDTMVNYLDGEIGSSDFHVSGIAQELLPFVFDRTKPLQADLTFQSDRLILQEILQRDIENPDSGIAFGIPFVGDLVMDVKVNHLEYDRFTADDLQLLGEIHGKRVKIDRLQTLFAGGRIDAFGRMNAENTDSILTNLDVKLTRINIPTVLKTFDDFGQEMLSHKRTEGDISGRFTYLDALPESLTPTFAHTRAEGNILVEGGELRRFEPFYQLPFFRRADVRQVKYDMRIENISLVDSILRIPELDFLGSIFHLQAQGKMKLGDDLDFNAQIQPHQQRSRIFEPRLLRAITSEPPRRSIVNLKIVGPTADPKIKYDWEKSGQNMWRRLFY